MNYDIRKQLEELQKKYFIAIDEAFKAKTVLGEAIFEEMRQDLFNRYKIEREQLNKQATIPDKNIDFETKLKIYELTPHNRGFLWIFKNEARKLKEREVDIDDRIELDARTDAVEQSEEKIYGAPEELEEQPKKLSLFKRLFKHRKQIHAAEELEATLQAADKAEPADVIEQPEPPAAVESASGTAAQATPENGSTFEPADVAQSSKPSTAAPDASDATHQSDSNAKNTNNVAQSPAHAQTSEKHKREPKRKKSAESTAEPTPAPCTAPAPQLPGQICIENITGNK